MSLTLFTFVVSTAVNVLVSVEALTWAENPQPLNPALAETDSETSLPWVTDIPIVVSSSRVRVALLSFSMLNWKTHSAESSSTSTIMALSEPLSRTSRIWPTRILPSATSFKFLCTEWSS